MVRMSLHGLPSASGIITPRAHARARGYVIGRGVYTELQVGCHRKRSSISRMRVHCHSKSMGFNAHACN